MANINLKKVSISNNSNSYYDIYAENGKLATTRTLDMQILVGLFVNQRVTNSEQPQKELQGGWAGNIIVSNNLTYEMGCKQWFYVNQGKLTNFTINSIKDTIRKDGLDWMVQDGLAKEITIETNEVNYNTGLLILTITIIYNNSIIEEYNIELLNANT